MDGQPGQAPCAVVVGASAGGVEALTAFVRALPPDLDAAVLVVLHLPSRTRSRLPEILDKAGPLPVARAESDVRLAHGRIVVAPPDTHLLVHAERTMLARGPWEDSHPAAVDALFRSAARWLGPRVAAVVLSGALDDGAAGAAAVAAQGGAVLVQDPLEALFDSMPTTARAAVPDALALPVGDLARRLPGLLDERPPRPVPAADHDLLLETDRAQRDAGAVSGTGSPGRPAGVSCPECHGAMPVVRTGRALHHLCHAGHAYGPASLVQAQTEASEAALWTAVASMEERVAVHRELARETSDAGRRAVHEAHAAEVAEQAHVLRRQLRTTRPRS